MFKELKGLITVKEVFLVVGLWVVTALASIAFWLLLVWGAVLVLQKMGVI